MQSTHTIGTAALLDDLHERGLFHQATDKEGLMTHLDAADPQQGGRRVYAGFDPTADSLTIGNLIPVMLLLHFQRAGHTPVVVMGGGTGLVGDPSGKSAERMLLDEEAVGRHIDKQRPIFERVLSTDGPNAMLLRNNAQWLGKLSYIEALRDVGKHFSVNAMMQKDSVRDRLHNREQGISYTEFSYMLLQAYDFLHLHNDDRVTVQLGGSDQWGNIVEGADLIRRCAAEKNGDGAKGFGLTAPLVTKADGGKFGKTESGAIWLTAARTSPYAYYQFWMNCSDQDAASFLKKFTLVALNEIRSICKEHAQTPGKRLAQTRLAEEATRLLHGEKGLAAAVAASRALFSGDVAGLDAGTLSEVFSTVPATEHERARLENSGVPLAELLPETSLAKSKRQARELLAAGAVSVNGEKAAPDDAVTAAKILHGDTVLLRRGKKAWHVTRWV